MEFDQIADLTLESSLGLFIIVVAYKLYRLKCGTHSKCCGDQLQVDLENPGVNNMSSI